MQALLGHVVDFVAAHASWAPYLAFLFAFAETLAFLSILASCKNSRITHPCVRKPVIGHG